MNWLFKSIRHLKAKVDYSTLSLKNRYPCQLLGEKYHPETHETIIIYRISVRRDIFEVSLRDLLDNALLLEKFHPADAVKLGFLACGEIQFGIGDPETRSRRYHDILNHMNRSSTYSKDEL